MEEKNRKRKMVLEEEGCPKIKLIGADYTELDRRLDPTMRGEQLYLWLEEETGVSRKDIRILHKGMHIREYDTLAAHHIDDGAILEFYQEVTGC